MSATAKKTMAPNGQEDVAGGADKQAMRKRPTIPSRLVAELWRSSSSYSQPKADAEIVLALLPARPRTFWRAVERTIIRGREESWPLIKAAVKDERLLRLCIGRVTRELGGFRGTFREYEQRAVLAHARPLFAGACKFREKSDAWLSNRLSPLMRALAEQPAAEAFDAIGLAAESGRLGAAQEILKAFPDQRVNSGDARLRYGRMGYSEGGMADVRARAEARSHLKKMAKEGDRAWMEPERDLRNAFFWLTAQAQAWRESSASHAAAWAAVAVELAARGAPCPMEAAYSCPELLGELERLRREAPDASQHRSPSFYSLSRPVILFEALLGASPATVAAICAHDANFRDLAQTFSARGGQAERVIPAAAIAMLAGHAPEEAWIPGASYGAFRIAGSVVGAAKEGRLSHEHIKEMSFATRPRSMTFESLARELGFATAALSGGMVKEPAPAKRPRGPKA